MRLKIVDPATDRRGAQVESFAELPQGRPSLVGQIQEHTDERCEVVAASRDHDAEELAHSRVVSEGVHEVIDRAVGRRDLHLLGKGFEDGLALAAPAYRGGFVPCDLNEVSRAAPRAIDVPSTRRGEEVGYRRRCNLNGLVPRVLIAAAP